MNLLLFSPLKENTIGNYLYIPKNWYGKRQARKDVDRPGHEKTARICNLLVLSGFELKKMVELVGVEPMTYTMRTYRSSQLSYSPIFLLPTFALLWSTFLKIAILLKNTSSKTKKSKENTTCFRKYRFFLALKGGKLCFFPIRHYNNSRGLKI